eukprot:582112-Rhodomonas_salina.1
MVLRGVAARGWLLALKRQSSPLYAYTCTTCVVLSMGRLVPGVAALLAAAESASEHPLALAILAKAQAELKGLPVPPCNQLEALSGLGLVADVGGVEGYGMLLQKKLGIAVQKFCTDSGKL